MKISHWCLLAIGLAIVVGLPFAGRWARGTSRNCALDGVKIVPTYRARIVDSGGSDNEFCCLRCAAIWLRRQEAPPRSVQVTDEVTGREIDASSAWYVRSLVVTVAHTDNRVHVFASRADADKHARSASGVVLTGAERPFSSLGSLPVDQRGGGE